MAISHPFGSPVLREKTPRTSHGACWNDAVFQAASERLSAGESTTLFCYCEACLLRRGDEVAQVPEARGHDEPSPEAQSQAWSGILVRFRHGLDMN